MITTLEELDISAKLLEKYCTIYGDWFQLGDFSIILRKPSRSALKKLMRYIIKGSFASKQTNIDWKIQNILKLVQRN